MGKLLYTCSPVKHVLEIMLQFESKVHTGIRQLVAMWGEWSLFFHILLLCTTNCDWKKYRRHYYITGKGEGSAGWGWPPPVVKKGHPFLSGQRIREMPFIAIWGTFCIKRFPCSFPAVPNGGASLTLSHHCSPLTRTICTHLWFKSLFAPLTGQGTYARAPPTFYNTGLPMYVSWRIHYLGTYSSVYRDIFLWQNSKHLRSESSNMNKRCYKFRHLVALTASESL